MIVFIWIVAVAICILVWNLFEDKIITYFEKKWRKRNKNSK
ncbi:hypothetical protein [Catellicoccus marimammalium]